MPKEMQTVALVVDDVKPNRKLLNNLLSREGYLVIEAENGEMAVDIVQHQHVDIIFMDVMMPGIDGYEATRQIKALIVDRFVPIIMVTALHEHQGMVTGIDAGADDYITKPIDAILLNAKVHAMERIRMLHKLLYEQNKELKEIQQRVADEQSLAESILNSAIGAQKDHIDGITATVEPAELFSGDLVLQSITPDGGWYVAVCDFTGHGLPAAVGTVPVTETFYSMAAKGLPANEILHELNFKLKNFLPVNMFMGCIFLEFSADTKKVSLWNGGMPVVLHKDSESGKIINRVDAKSLALGIIDMTKDEIILDEMELNENDSLVLYSDGLTEAEAENGEQLGMARLEAVVEASSGESLESSIISVWKEFQSADKQLDDVTLVTVQYKT